MANKVKVLIVDDSALVRKRLKEALDSDNGIEVVGHAPDPFIARDKILSLKPDVLTLDIEMPRMDGLTFLKKLMQYFPVPVVVVSSYTQEGCKATIEALELGAIEVMAKPLITEQDTSEMAVFTSELCEKVKLAATVKLKPGISTPRPVAPAAPIRRAVTAAGNKIIALGASTGGTEALRDVLQALPAGSPPVVIVQHMPKGFTKAFADRLNGICEIEVMEGRDGMQAAPGTAIIAPGDEHMLLKRTGNAYSVSVKSGPLVCRHRPSVEVLFESVAKSAGPNATAALLTGMGKDGAEGLLKVKDAGGMTIAQDEASCIVFGMPKEAIKLGAAQKIVALNHIAETILT